MLINPLGISAIHDRRPRELIQKEEKAKQDQEEQERLAYENALAGKERTKSAWRGCYRLPDRRHQIGWKDAQHPMLDKEAYVDPVKELAARLRDDSEAGKPEFAVYTRPLRPSDLNYEFGGIHKPFKILH